MNEELGEFMRNVAALRKNNGLSKRRMAALLGVSVRTLNMLESGVFPPRLRVDVVFRIQKHFGIAMKDQWG